MVIIKLPYNFNKNTMYSFIESVIDEEMNPISSEIKFKFNSLGFIEPAGVTILSNVIQWLKQREVKITFTYPKDTNEEPTKGIKYLDDSMFFEHYLDKTLTNDANVRTTTMPIKFITYDRSRIWLEGEFIPWLSGRLNITTNSLADIFNCFGEIFNNIRDHAGENMGCIFSQHYPKKNQIKISISDFGVGIPDTIRRVRPNLDDDEALRVAIEEGVSSKSTPKNRGAGLNTLVYNVVKNYGGTVQIRSFSGILSVHRDKSNEFVVNCSKVKQKYPGTFFEIVFNTDNFYDLPEEEEFIWD